jgi:hypothetical protein
MMTTTTTVEEFLDQIAPSDVPLPEEKEQDEKDPSKLKQRKPPKDGPCKRCGENKPLNRLLLCYPCWVKSELEKDGWREGQPHPDSCHCEGLSGHQRLSEGN